MRRALAAVLVTAACGAPPARVTPIAGPPAGGAQASDPALGVDPATGDVLLAWVAGDSSGWHVLFARSADAGATWTDPVRVTDRPHDVHPHGESSPRLVAATGGRVAIVWIRSVPAAGRRWPGSDVRLATARDGGRSWSGAITLNDDTAAGPGGHIFHGAAWRGDSGIVVAWMDERGGATPGDAAGGAHLGHHEAAPTATADAEPDATVYAAESRDWGRSWEPNRALWGAACPCCRITLARSLDGAVRAAWRQHFAGGVRDVVIAPVPGQAARVHRDGWVYPGCPHTGPGMAIDASGRLHLAWYRGVTGAAGVAYALGAPDEPFTTVAVTSAATMPTAHPRVAPLDGGGALVVSDVNAAGRARLVVARVTVAGAVAAAVDVPGSDGADHPEVVALPGGGAVVAWTERRDRRAALRLARIEVP